MSREFKRACRLLWRHARDLHQSDNMYDATHGFMAITKALAAYTGRRQVDIADAVFEST